MADAMQVARIGPHRLVTDEKGNFIVETLSRDALGKRRWNSIAAVPKPKSKDDDDDDEGCWWGGGNSPSASLHGFLVEYARFKDLERQKARLAARLAGEDS